MADGQHFLLHPSVWSLTITALLTVFISIRQLIIRFWMSGSAVYSE
jgi:hypothetical protein